MPSSLLVTGEMPSRRRTSIFSLITVCVLASVAFPQPGKAATPLDAKAPTSQAHSDKLALSCDKWIGDYAFKPGESASMRIERGSEGFTARDKLPDGSWNPETTEAKDVSNDPDLDLHIAHACVLAIDGGLLIKAPVGTAYQATSQAGQNFADYHMATDSLLLIMQGFQVDGHDLYAVAAKGVSPPPPPRLPKAATGKEVATAAACPQGQPRVMTQAAFDAMPADYKSAFHQLEPAGQSGVLCGQRLSDLLNEDSFTAVSLNANRAATLRETLILLKAGEQPRDMDGHSTWWDGAGHWLMRNNSMTATDTTPIPLQNEYNETFNSDILPRLPKPDPDNFQAVVQVVRYILAMPDAQAVAAMQRFQATGVLTMEDGYGGNIADEVLARALSPQVSEGVFEIVQKAVKPQSGATRELFDDVIDNDNMTGATRLLQHGYDPRDSDILLRASAHPKLYELLLQESFKRSASTDGKLPPAVIDPLVRAALQKDKTVDWDAIDLLVKHGGDLSRSFTSVTDEQDSLAYFARTYPDRFMAALDHGLRVDLPYPVGGNALLTRYVMLGISWQKEGPRADVVEAMLHRYNNAESGKPCSDCRYGPLIVAIESDNLDVVKVLLRYGANPNTADSLGFPAFVYAVAGDRVDMLDAMMHSPTPPNLKYVDRDGTSLLATARCYDAPKSADWLRQHGAGQPDQGYESCRKAVEAARKAPSNKSPSP